MKIVKRIAMYLSEEKRGGFECLEEDWLEAHPEFNQVLHDIHVEITEQMIDYILGHAAEFHYHDL